MLIAGIFIIFLLTMLTAFVLKRRGVRMAYIWLILTLLGFVVWLLLLVIPHDRINPFEINNWYQITDYQVGLRFHLDQSNWTIVFSLFTFHLAFLLTSLARLDIRTDFKFWIMEAGQIALTYAVLTAGDLRTLILTWTALDMADLFYWLFVKKTVDNTKIFKPYVFKLIGSLLLILNIARLAGTGQSLLLEKFPSTASVSLFFAALLHSGILPVMKHEKSARFMENFLDFSTYFFSYLTSFFLIIYLPAHSLPMLLNSVMALLFLVIVFYFGNKWLKALDEISGAYDLLVAFSGFFAYLFLSNYQIQLVNWLVILIICLTWLLLYTHRSNMVVLFPVLMLFSLSGLPFSLVSYGSHGLFSQGISFSAILLLVPHILILTGFIRLLFLKRNRLGKLEPWFQAIYMAGLFLPILAISAIILNAITSLIDELVFWWMGMFVTIAAIGLYFWLEGQEKHAPKDKESENTKTDRLSNFLSLKWMYTISSFLGARVGVFVTGFSQLLEGEGGVLWAIVFMALLITLLRTG